MQVKKGEFLKNRFMFSAMLVTLFVLVLLYVYAVTVTVGVGNKANVGLNFTNLTGSVNLNCTLAAGMNVTNVTWFAVQGGTITMIATNQTNITSPTPGAVHGDNVTTSFVYPAFSTTTLADGRYNITCNVTNSSIFRYTSGVIASDPAYNVTIDNTAPAYYGLKPGNNSYTNSTGPTVVVYFNDTGAKINTASITMYYSVNNTGFSNVVPTTSDDLLDSSLINVNGTLSNAGIINGANITIQVNASDWGGNTKYFNWTFHIDNATPSALTLNAPPNSTMNLGNNVSFNFTVTDDYSTTLNCSLLIGNGTVTSSTTIYATSGTMSNYTARQLGEGPHIWNVTCSDNATNTRSSPNVNVTIDAVLPLVGLLTPTVANWTVQNNVTGFQYQANDTGLFACQLYTNYSGTWLANKTNTSASDGLINATTDTVNMTLKEGHILWNVLCNDSVGNAVWGLTSGRNMSVTVDTMNPSITLNSPSTNAYRNAPNATFSYTLTDAWPSVCNLTINRTGAFVTNLTNTTPVSGIANTMDVNLSTGIYKWNIYCNDTSARTSTTSTNFTITIDTTFPMVGFEYPVNDFNFSGATVKFNGSSNDTNLYLTSHNFTSKFPTNNGTNASFQFINTSGLADGNYSVNISVNDSAGNLNTSTNLYFRVDNTAPTTHDIFPVNGTGVNITTPQIYLNITDATTGIINNTNLNVSISINGGAFNPQAAVKGPGVSGAQFIMNCTACSLGYSQNDNVTVRVNAQDHAGNLMSVDYWFIVDSVIPNVTLVSPVNNTWTRARTVSFTYNMSDRAPYQCNLTTNSTKGTLLVTNATNLSVTPQVPPTVNLTLESDGAFQWAVFCNDTSGNINTSGTFNVNIDTTDPVVNLVAPINNSYNNTLNMMFNWSATDINIQNCTLYHNGSGTFAANQTFGATSGALANTSSIFATPGIKIWNVLCNDTSGRTAFNATNRTLILDNTTSGINLLSPANATMTQSRTVSFTYNATDETALGTCNLTTNSSVGSRLVANSTNSSGNGLISGTAASVNLTFESDGQYLWNVYCLDNASNTAYNFTNRSFTIDSTNPVVDLLTPNQTTFMTQVVSLGYRVTEVNPASCILYDNIGGTWTNRVTNSSLSSGSTDNVTITVGVDGTYIWNVYCNDTFGRTAWNATNFTVTVSANAPTISAMSPKSNETVTNSTPLVSLNTSEPSTCKWDYADGRYSSMPYTMTGTLVTNHNYTFPTTLRDAAYKLFVRCVDSNSTEPNIGTQVNVNLDTRSNFNITRPDTLYDYLQINKWNAFALPLWTWQNATTLKPNATNVLSSVDGSYSKFYVYNGSAWQTYIPGAVGNDFVNITYNGGEAFYYLYMNGTDRLEV